MNITYKTFKTVFMKEITRVIEDVIEDSILPKSTTARIKGCAEKREEELLVLECMICGQTVSVSTDMKYLYFLYKERDISIFDIDSHILEEFISGLKERFPK